MVIVMKNGLTATKFVATKRVIPCSVGWRQGEVMPWQLSVILSPLVTVISTIIVSVPGSEVKVTSTDIEAVRACGASAGGSLSRRRQQSLAQWPLRRQSEHLIGSRQELAQRSLARQLKHRSLLLLMNKLRAGLKHFSTVVNYLNIPN